MIETLGEPKMQDFAQLSLQLALQALEYGFMIGEHNFIKDEG